MLRELNVEVPAYFGIQKIETIANRLPFFGGKQFTIDTTIISTWFGPGKTCECIAIQAIKESQGNKAQLIKHSVWEALPTRSDEFPSSRTMCRRYYQVPVCCCLTQNASSTTPTAKIHTVDVLSKMSRTSRARQTENMCR